MKQHNSCSFSLVFQRRKLAFSKPIDAVSDEFCHWFETSGKPFDRREERWRTGRRRGGSVGKGRGRGSPCRAKERGCGTSPCTDERLHPSLWSQVHDASSCVARCFDDASSWVFRAACASYARHEIRSVSETFWTEFDRNGAGRRNSSAKSLWVNDSYVNYGSR